MRIWIAATCRGLGAKVQSPRAKVQGSTFYVLRVACCVSDPRSEVQYFSSYSLHAPYSVLRTPKGFTLLELSLVLFIIGLLVTILLPRFGAMGTARLESSARRLAALVRYLNGEAAFRGQVYRIRYDLSEQTYAVQVLMPSRGATEFMADSSPMSQPVRLPAGITFADVRVAQAGRMTSGQVFTHFYPQGYVDSTIVHLRDQQERVMTVMIPPITGEARVYEGYIDGNVR